MAMSFFSLLLLTVSSGQYNDLLDLLQTRAYWANQGVTLSAQSMEAELAPGKDPATKPRSGPKAAAVRRLMAIRALGELKSATSLPALRALAGSKALFEADYAAAAIAAIEGKPYTRPKGAAKELQKDVWMLPAECATVGQIKMLPGKPVDYDAILKEFAAMSGGEMPGKALDQLTGQLVMVAEYAGNFRIDGLTIGLPGEIGPNSGYVVLIARGKYDSAHLKKMILEAGGPRCESKTVDGVEVVSPDRSVAIVLPSDDCLVFMTGPRAEALPVAAMAAAIKAGRGTLAPESEMGKLIGSLDASAPLWAAMKVSEGYRKAPPLAPFDTMTLVGTHDKDALAIKLVARGADAAKIASTISEFNIQLQDAREAVKQQGQIPKAIGDFLGSVTVTSEANTATVTARLKGGSVAMALLPWFALRPSPRPAPPPGEAPGGPAPGPDNF